MRLVFGGAEVPANKNALQSMDVKDVGVSFVGLSRRLKFARPWHLADHYPDGVSILVDSGAHSVNKDEMKYSQRELKEMAEKYKTFIEWNLDNDNIEGITEFDALPLGREWIENERRDFYAALPEGLFIPVWHPEFGLDNLESLANEYARVAVPSVDLSGRDLTPLLNKLANSGVRIHGISMTKPDVMAEVKWDSVSSTSWLSPQQYGDTIVWTGRELKRYPKKQKQQARLRYRTLFTRNGFDAEKIESDDSSELLRLSIWSWSQLVDHINSKGHVEVKKVDFDLQPVTTSGEVDTPGNVEIEGVGVDTHPSEPRNEVATREIVKTRPTVPLPVIGVTRTEETNPDTEEVTVRTEVNIRSTSQRVCDNCFLAKNCPGFEPASTCAYDIPIEIKTKTQLTQLHNSMIEIQAQRVLFMRMAEEQEGGYADPNLSTEMDRLNKMVKTKHDMETDKVSFKIEGSATGEAARAGALSRIFGDKASERAQALPAPISVEQALPILDAEIINE